jgi:hypothetical protein
METSLLLENGDFTVAGEWRLHCRWGMETSLSLGKGDFIVAGEGLQNFGLY